MYALGGFPKDGRIQIFPKFCTCLTHYVPNRTKLALFLFTFQRRSEARTETKSADTKNWSRMWTDWGERWTAWGRAWTDYSRGSTLSTTPSTMRATSLRSLMKATSPCSPRLRRLCNWDRHVEESMITRPSESIQILLIRHIVCQTRFLRACEAVRVYKSILSSSGHLVEYS